MNRIPVPTRLAGRVACVLLWLCTTNPAFAQTLGQGADDDISIWRVLGALFLCLALAVAGAFAIRARLGGSPALPRMIRRDRRLQLVESLRLSHQVDLCIVTCDGRELLLATSAQGVDQLGHVPLPSSDATQTEATVQ